MSKHTIIAKIEVKFRIPDMPDDERESAWPKVEIAYTFTAGSPEVRYQRNGDPGWPADADEVELVSAKLIDGDGLDPTSQQIDEWAEDWLNDKGYEAAVKNAGADNEPDPDYASDRAEEDRYDARHDIGGDDF